MVDDDLQKQTEADLQALVDTHYPGMTVSVEPTSRWDRPVVTFTWSGFADLMPEERFERLLRIIPEAFRDARMAEMVWLELAADETVEAFFKLPRSEDGASRESEVHSQFLQAGLLEAVTALLGNQPERACGGDFALLTKAGRDADLSAEALADIKLMFIRHGAYCDCQAVFTVAPQLATARKPAKKKAKRKSKAKG